METGFAKKVKELATYVGIVIASLAWLDTRYMGSHKELLAVIETHHTEVLAMERGQVEIRKDVEYLREDFNRFMAEKQEPKSDHTPSRSGRETTMYALPPNDKDKPKFKEEYLASN